MDEHRDFTWLNMFEMVTTNDENGQNCKNGCSNDWNCPKMFEVVRIKRFKSWSIFDIVHKKTSFAGWLISIAKKRRISFYPSSRLGVTSGRPGPNADGKVGEFEDQLAEFPGDTRGGTAAVGYRGYRCGYHHDHDDDDDDDDHHDHDHDDDDHHDHHSSSFVIIRHHSSSFVIIRHHSSSFVIICHHHQSQKPYHDF